MRCAVDVIVPLDQSRQVVHIICCHVGGGRRAGFQDASTRQLQAFQGLQTALGRLMALGARRGRSAERTKDGRSIVGLLPLLATKRGRNPRRALCSAYIIGNSPEPLYCIRSTHHTVSPEKGESNGPARKLSYLPTLGVTQSMLPREKIEAMNAIFLSLFK